MINMTMAKSIRFSLQRFAQIAQPPACCCLLLILFLIPSNVDAQSADATTTAQQAIGQLRDSSFAVRESATRRLLQLGIQIQPQLIEAINHPDAEVRQRIRRILHSVMEEDLRKRMNHFSTGKSIAGGQQLPGWDHYRTIVGSDEPAREQFAKALQAEPILMESLEQETAYTARAIQIRTQVLYRELIRTPGSNAPGNSSSSLHKDSTPIASVTALLIASTNQDIPIDEQTGQKIFQLMQHSGFTQQLSANDGPTPARQLAGHFIRHSTGTSLAYQMLWLAMQCNLKEGLIPAEAIIRDENQQPYVLQNAMLAIGKLGGEEQLDLLDSFLSDDTPVNNRRATSGFNPKIQDVALAVTIHIHGQNPGDFGFKKIRKNAQTLFQANTMGFDSQRSREDAFTQWETWLSKQKTSEQ
jgi:hypothetical protein